MLTGFFGYFVALAIGNGNGIEGNPGGMAIGIGGMAIGIGGAAIVLRTSVFCNQDGASLFACSPIKLPQILLFQPFTMSIESNFDIL